MKTKFLYALFAWLAVLLWGVRPAVGQVSEAWFVNRTDTVVAQMLTETTTRWVANGRTHLLRFNFRNEIWIEHPHYSLWQLGEQSQVWTLPGAFRLWLAPEGLAVWKYQVQHNDWFRQGFAPQFALHDSATLYRINDTLCITTEARTARLWQVDPHVAYWQREWAGNYNVWQLNDTTTFWKVDSIQHLQLFQDSTQHWQLDQHPARLALSAHTVIWTLLPNTEVWKAGKRINIWSLNAQHQWRVNDSIPFFQKVNGQKLWLINPDLKVMALGDSVQVWRRNPGTKVWAVSADERLWHFVPPPPPSKLAPAEPVKHPQYAQEKVQLLAQTKDRRGWQLDDSTQVWQFERHNEFWQRRPQLNRWQVNDSTVLWHLSDRYQLTREQGRYRFWNIAPGEKVWKEMPAPRYWQRNDTAHTWWLDNDLAITAQRQRIELWRVHRHLHIAYRGDGSWWATADTAQVWQTADTTLIEYRNTSHPGHVWHQQQYPQLPLSDTLSVWRVGQNLRVARGADSLSFWQWKTDWVRIDSVHSTRLDDTTRVWHVQPQLQIWEGPRSTRFWLRDDNSRVFRLRDTIRAWTYPPPPPSAQVPKNSRWKLNGHLKLNTHQNQLRNWVQGGESYVALQSEARADWIYEGERLRWQSWTELKYGINIRGENAVQKNDDKIEVDSRLVHKRKHRPWSFTTHTNLRTQFTEGRDYAKNIQVSDFWSPVYFNLGLGMAYDRPGLFNLYLSPLTARVIYVADTLHVDQTKFGIAADQRSQNQTGAYVNANLGVNLARNIRLESRITLFSNYFRNPQNIDVDWLLDLLMSINKYISTHFTLKLLYDDDTKIPIYQNLNDKRQKVGEGPRVQMQEVFNVGFLFRF